jgi:superfamily II DNA or RNA helicase
MSRPTLFKHQTETVEFYKTHAYCLNGSEPGTGKTFSAIEFSGGKKTTVVAPAFLLRNWQREFAKFGIKATIFPVVSTTTLISQDQIHKSAIPFHHLDVLIVDECHGFCNLTTRRTKALHSYVSDFLPKSLLLMSGTPMRNRVPELYSLLRLVYQKMGGNPFKQKFPSQYVFNLTFSYPIEKKFGGRKVTTFEGSRNLDALRGWIKPIYIKHLLEDLEDVPEVFYEEVEADEEDDPILWTVDEELEKGWEAMEVFKAPPPAHISTAKLSSALAKVAYTIELCKSLLDGGVESLVVFSDHVKPSQDIAEGLAEYGSGVITGETTMPNRDAIVVKFQAGGIRVLVGSIGAMGTGLTLTKSHVCVRNDKSWIPASNYQAVGRLRRLTQKHKVRVIDVVRPGVDQRISKKLTEKEKIIQEVT